MSSRSRNARGASFVEFTAVFPILLLLTMGGMDFTLLMIKWVSLHKAADVGARKASLMKPVAIGINDPTTGSAADVAAGTACYDFTTHATTGKCVAKVATVCTADASGGRCCPLGSNPASCAANYQWNEATFAKVLGVMNGYMITGSLDRRQVQITYQPTGFGYAQRPVGAPMNVTVSLRCTTYPFYLLYPLMGWAFPAKPSDCAGVPGSGLVLGSFQSTVPAEFLNSSN